MAKPSSEREARDLQDLLQPVSTVLVPIFFVLIGSGEVGLIFAGIGAALMLPSSTGVNEPAIGSAVFGAVVIMVIITTLITPLALKWALARKGNRIREGLNHGKEGSA